MSLILVVSIVVRGAALFWSCVLLRRCRDWRMAFLLLMLSFMACRQTLTLATHWTGWSLHWSASLDELPGLVVSIMALVFVVLLERMLSAGRHTEEQLRLALDATAEGFWDWDIPSGKVFFSPQWFRSLGYQPGELEMDVETKKKLMHPDDLPGATQALDEHLAGYTDVCECENRLLMRSGDYRLNRGRGRVVARDSEGHPLRMVGTDTDITATKHAEDTATTLGRIVEESVNEIYVVDVQARKFCLGNRGVRENTGYSAEEFQDLIPMDLSPMLTPERFGELIERLTSGEATVSLESVHKRKDGTTYDVDVWLQLVQYHGRECVFAVVLDITDRNRREHEVDALTTRLKLVIKAARIGLWDWSIEGGEVYFSPEYKAQLGYGPDELDASFDAWKSRLHSDDADRVLSYVQGLLSDGTTHYRTEFRLRHRDGSYRWILSDGVVLRDEGGQPLRIVGAHIDLTEQKNVEESLRISQHAMECAFDGILITDPTLPDNPIIYVNPAMERITGYAADEAVGRNCRFLQNGDRDQSGIDEVRRAIDEQRECRVELKNYRKDGTPFWNQLTIAPVADGEGRVTHFVGIQSDITDRRESQVALQQANDTLEERVRQRTAEREEALDRLRGQEQKLAHFARVTTLAEMVGGIAHEINQPLHNISTLCAVSAKLLARDDLRRDTLKNAVEQIEQSALLSGEIIRRMRSYVKPSAGQRVPEPINAIVNDSVQLTDSVARRFNVSVVTQLEENIRDVVVDRVQIQQVIVNLLQNACEALADIGGSRRILVQTGSSGSTVEVSVTDNGIGPEADAECSVFDAFYTTKASGLGMGLAISRSIVEAHSGSIRMTRHENNSTVVRFSISVRDESQSPVKEPADVA